MELPTIESFGIIDRNICVLNSDEYAFIAGSYIVVKQFKTTGDKGLRFLRSEFSHFTAMDFNFNQEQGTLATCESGRNALIRLYSYSKYHGFGESAQNNNIYTPLSETSISKALEVTCLNLSKECTRLVALVPEPQLCLKVYDINEQMQLSSALTIPLEKEYSVCKISPINKNHIFLMHRNYCSLVEIKDSFKETYQTLITEDKDINTVKSAEEMELDKRYELIHLKIPQLIDDFIDFTWDIYNNIYIALSSGEIQLYDANLNRMSVTVLGETRDSIRLPRCATSLLMSQRFLLCFQDNGKIACVNIYIPEKELPSFKPSIGFPENYRMLEMEKELTPSVFNFISDNSKADPVIHMKYDPEMRKIIAVTDSSLIVVMYKAEILIKDKEKEADNDDRGNTLNNEIDSYEEMKFHAGKIICIKELGNTSQFVTVGTDRKLIIWELADRTALFSHSFGFDPNSIETDIEGNLIFIGTKQGVLRIYDISSRSMMKLVFMTKYQNINHKDIQIDKILVHPFMKYVVFFEKGDTTINFISGEIGKNFQFIGHIQIPAGVLDVALHQNGEIIVLIKNFLISCKVNSFIFDHKSAIEIKPKKVLDLFSKFELKCDFKFKRIDGDLKMIIKNYSADTMWLTGDEKYIRQYGIPQETLEIIKKNLKAPTETPLKDYKGHDLEISCGVVTNGTNGSNYLITAGLDGFIHIRKEDKEKPEKINRCHSFIKEGITSIYYSPSRHLIYTAGNDGSIFIISVEEENSIPSDPVSNNATNEILLNLESQEPLQDNYVKSFNEIIKDEHHQLVKKTKKSSQQTHKAKLEEIRSELNKIINENSRLEEIEQLSKEALIIDFRRIENEVKEGKDNANEKIKIYFKELCEKEIKRIKLFEKTYDLMRVKEESGLSNVSKNVNNNIRMVTSNSGNKILKTYPIRKISEEETMKINYAKQLRLMELNEKYKRRNDKIKETVDEYLFSKCDEQYIINRVPAKVVLMESEIRPQDVADTNATDEGGKLGADGGQYKVAKYKLQRHPYADELNVGAKQEENNDQVSYKPDEQLLKEDLVYKFKTVVDFAKGIGDVEFQRNLHDIDPYTLLYSPFELYTTFRMRNQIYLILDIIQNLKATFNKEFRTFIAERNASLEKFNTNKIAIDAIKEVLISLGSDVNVEDYSYTINPHEDNEWVEKLDENEIILKIPKYFSKEEKLRKEEEMRREEERIKALQGDTLEMRGLKTMIEHKSLKSKQTNNDEQELVKETWMDKEKKDMTEDEIRRLTDFVRKEKEISERKEKIRSQNMTKLNSHKMEIENIKTDMDSKFLKFLKKKLYYDYRVTEQELYINALTRTMEYKNEIKQLLKDSKNNLQKINNDVIKAKDKVNDFTENFKKFNEAYDNFITGYNERNKNNKLIETEKSLFDNFEFSQLDKENLQKFRSDPYFFFEREKLKQVKKYGNKAFKEISQVFIKNTGPANQKSTQEDNINLINQKYYLDYKNEQMNSHKNYLENEQEVLENKKKELENTFNKYDTDFKKSHLNFDFLLRIKKGQDEISDILGPQQFIDEAFLIDHSYIEDLNKRINNIYTTLKSNSNTEKDHNVILQYLELENTKTDLTKHEIELKLRYLKLTRVTKKIQEIVTGREDIDHNQIALVYDQKKRNLEDNKTKRIETMIGKLKELDTEIEKKRKENTEFIEKSQKLNQEVKLKEQIIDLDNDDNGGMNNENNQNSKSKTKSLEIAQVTKLKNLVQQYYEEIEYLRTELDRLRARTFPSFLQKPDQIVYPDEK